MSQMLKSYYSNFTSQHCMRASYFFVPYIKPCLGFVGLISVVINKSMIFLGFFYFSSLVYLVPFAKPASPSADLSVKDFLSFDKSAVIFVSPSFI